MLSNSFCRSCKCHNMPGHELSLSLAAVSGNNGLLWTTSGTGTFSNPAALNPVYTPSAADINNGSVVLTLTAYGNPPCGNANSSMTLFINKSPLAEMQARIPQYAREQPIRSVEQVLPTILVFYGLHQAPERLQMQQRLHQPMRRQQAADRNSPVNPDSKPAGRMCDSSCIHDDDNDQWSSNSQCRTGCDNL